MMVLQWIDAVAVVHRSLVQLPVLSARCPTGRDCKGSSQAYFPPVSFFLVVLCFGRPLLCSLCLLMSIVEPTAEGTTQPKRNKETTRVPQTVCSWQLEKALGNTYVVQTPRVKVEMGNCIVLYVQFGCHQRVPS